MRGTLFQKANKKTESVLIDAVWMSCWLLTAQSPEGILSGGACIMLTSVGMRRICMGPWQPSIWASSLKMSWARDATTGSENRRGIKEASHNTRKYFFLKRNRLSSQHWVPLLYLRNMAMVRGQILFSALVVKAGSTVQTMHRVSMTRVSTSELNWAASWTSPSRTLGRNGWRTWVLSDSFSWSQYLHKGFKVNVSTRACQTVTERLAHPQMALTAEMRTEGGWVTWRPLTVAWRNCWISSGDMAVVKRLAAHKARPRRNGDAAGETTPRQKTEVNTTEEREDSTLPRVSNK